MIYNANEIFDFMRYPAGEPHVTITERLRSGENAATQLGHTEAIIWQARNFDDLALMVAAWETLERRFQKSPKFVVPYFPFGRHDRRRGSWDSDPLHIALEIVRPMLKGNKLITIDPHSDVSGVIPHISQASVVEAFGIEGAFSHSPTFIIPDSGATKKTYEWAGKFHVPVIQGYKKRDPRTGELTGFSVDTEQLAEKMHLAFVDDICDGGGTFLGLLEVVRSVTLSASLLVTHGLYTKGIDSLSDNFDLWTLDVYDKPEYNKRVRTINTKMLIAEAFRTNNFR